MGCLEESQALAFVAGDLADPASVEAHIDDCPSCRQLLAELVRRSQDPSRDDTLLPSGPALDHGDWAPGTKVGRYVVLARIGHGGMGTVFRAEDIELGRPVALKRLHADADADSRARLVREARSAAQLQHPNVVTVHEVGVDQGTPFLAMELVDGVTLTAWLKDKPRSWREIVAVVAQAGRGLIAAHERGLVHRDFKPDNVLVDRTGRARVADFGLARAGDSPHEIATPISHDARLARMTATGSLAGTPAYLAPELVEGGAPDARSDQYAFAITLYEALSGQYPFAGTTPLHVWAEMAAGRIRVGRPMPAWLERHVRRGLDVDPRKRWPDVASFLTAIEKPPRRWRWIALGAGVATVASTIAFVALREPAAQDPSCDQLAKEYRVNFRDEDLARAIPDPAQLKLARKAIDEFTVDYRKALRDSCRATRAGTQSATIGDKRSACLELAKRRAWFVTSGITTGIDKRPGLQTLLEELPDPLACSDPEWLGRQSPLPVGQADRDALYRAESDLLRANTTRDSGDLAQASTLVASVGTTAKRLNDRILDARASLLASEIAHDRGDMEQAALDATEAWSAASAGGDTKLTLRAQLAMLLATAAQNRRSIEGFAGLGEVPESIDGARLISSYGDALMEAGRFKDGEAQYRRAQAMREKLLPPEHVDRALGQERIGAALVIQKRAAEALPILQQAHAIVDKAFPPLRREAIDGVRFLAMAEKELGHHERSLELYREVFARRAKVHGAQSLMAFEARADIAEELGNLGRDDESIRELEAAIAGFIAALGERSVNAQDRRIQLANKLISAGRFAEADAALAKAVPVIRRVKGDDSPYTMVGEYAQVRSWIERPAPIKLAEAARTLARIEPIFTKTFGARSYPVGAVIYSRARIALAKHDAKTADALMQQAMPMFGDDNRADRAEGELFHARVLWALDKTAEARERAEASARDYDASGAGFANKAQASRAWAAKPH